MSTPPIHRYETSFANHGLPNVPFHATPLLRAHDEYANLDMATRKRLLASFGVFVQQLPVKYRSFVYRSAEFGGAEKLQALIRRDLASLLVDNLEFFQGYEKVKIYYDGGQPAVTHALKAAFEYALSKQAYVERQTDYRSFRLAQVADYLCAIELTAVKFETRKTTPTDDKFFGGVGSFKRNWLKQARRKQMS